MKLPCISGFVPGIFPLNENLVN